MTPLVSTRNALGMPLRPAAAIQVWAIWPFSFVVLLSSATRYVILSAIFFTKGATNESSRSQQSWPITTSPLSLYLLWISLIWGIETRQGPHQVAQNSTM